jgi:hypothetical protein
MMVFENGIAEFCKVYGGKLVDLPTSVYELFRRPITLLADPNFGVSASEF